MNALPYKGRTTVGEAGHLPKGRELESQTKHPYKGMSVSGGGGDPLPPIPDYRITGYMDQRKKFVQVPSYLANFKLLGGKMSLFACTDFVY